MEHIRIIAPGDPGFDWLYDLYMQSFPVHEQRLRERQEGVLGHPEYHCDLLCQGETRVGLLMWWAGPGFLLCGAFRHRPQLRGQSWGSRALREFLAEGDPVVLEIDPPEDPVSRRRKGFYEGLGLVSNPWPHIHPPYRLEFSGPRPGGDDLSRRLGRGTVPGALPDIWTRWSWQTALRRRRGRKWSILQVPASASPVRSPRPGSCGGRKSG